MYNSTDLFSNTILLAYLKGLSQATALEMNGTINGWVSPAVVDLVVLNSLVYFVIKLIIASKLQVHFSLSLHLSVNLRITGSLEDTD